MQTLLQDVRYSLRMMAKSPGFVAAAVISLALGIGPNTMIFGLANALLLRPLPVDKPDELVRVFRSGRNNPHNSLSYPDYIDYRDRQQVFTGLAASQRMIMSANIDGQPEAVSGAIVSANFFRILGVQPLLGRAFAPEEDESPGAHPVAIISYNLWQRRFNGDPSLLGRALRLNGHNFIIIGVAAKSFTGLDAGFATDIWIPITMYATLMPNLADAFDPIKGREQSWINDVIGRFKPGISIGQAKSNLSDISAQLDSTYPSRRANRRRAITLFPVSSGHPGMRTAILPFAALLTLVAGIVLLIACANVANLLLTRAAARHKEIAIRLSLGANRMRLVRQLLTESVVLAFAGGAAGILLSYWASGLLQTFKPPVPIPVTIDLSMDYRVLCFSLVISFLTGIAFGLAPALQISRPDLVPALKAEIVSFGRGFKESRLHSLLVIAQMALSLVLLIGAALLFRSMQNAHGADPGFEKKNLIMLSTDLNLRGYTSAEGSRFYRQLIDRTQALPGMHSVSLTNLFPLSFSSSEIPIIVEGRESQQGSGMNEVGTSDVAPGYFETMRIPLVQGREFNYHDTETGQKVIIINQAMANRFWPGENPIGKRIKFDPPDPQNPYYEVIGVAKDSKFLSLGESPRPFMYLCILQGYSSSITLIARTESDPERMLSAMRREVQALDGDLLIYNAKTMTEHLEMPLFPLRMGTMLLGLLGALALLLASVGLYAIVAYSVTLRTRELGIRMALGAQSIQVLKSVLTRGTALAVIGIVIGLVLALAMARAMSSLGLLYGIGTTDPSTFLGVPLLLVSVAVLASYLPARRATKIDPVIALRQE